MRCNKSSEKLQTSLQAYSTSKDVRIFLLAFIFLLPEIRKLSELLRERQRILENLSHKFHYASLRLTAFRHEVIIRRQWSGNAVAISLTSKGGKYMFNKFLLSMAMIVSIFSFTQVSFADNANFGGKSESLSPEEKFAEVKQKAESGSSKDQLSLGRMYHNGVGVAKDDAKAAEWWKKAAAQGNEVAQESLNGLHAKKSK